jgi:SAM-dependent methyltransferase
MSIDALKDEIRRRGPWHYDIEIAPGVSTGAPEFSDGHAPELGRPSITDPFRDMRLLAEDLWPRGFDGRSFLDCACNAGGHSFAAKALGAGRVFGFDVREHWIQQARFLARHLPSEDVRFEVMELAALETAEEFDVTLFRGIFYHLPDPMAGLKLAADRTKELLIVNTSGKPGPEPGLVLSMEDDIHVMSGVDRLAWLPTGPETVQAVLAWCGFPHSRVRLNWPTSNGWSRMEVLAARNASTFAHFDAKEHKISKYRGPLRPQLVDRLRRTLRI